MGGGPAGTEGAAGRECAGQWVCGDWACAPGARAKDPGCSGVMEKGDPVTG